MPEEKSKTTAQIKPERAREEPKIIEKVISVNRTAKVVKGGRHFSFSALVVVGNGSGQMGYGFGKAREVAEAIQKGLGIAKRYMFNIPLNGTTIVHEVIGHFAASRVLLKPASQGTGVIAGGPVRAICEVAGIKDILTKSLRSDNALNVARACIKGLLSLKTEKNEPATEQAQEEALDETE